MNKIYKQLTAEQKERNVVFSSTLSKGRTEKSTDTTHEVHNNDTDKDETIRRLLDDSFFNRSPNFNHNIVREWGG